MPENFTVFKPSLMANRSAVKLLLVPDTFFILIIYALFAFRIYLFYSRKADQFGKNLSNITSNIGKWTSSIFNNLKYLKAISKDRLAKEAAKDIFIKFANSYENARVASYKSKLITEIMTIIFVFILPLPQFLSSPHRHLLSVLVAFSNSDAKTQVKGTRRNSEQGTVYLIILRLWRSAT